MARLAAPLLIAVLCATGGVAMSGEEEREPVGFRTLGELDGALIPWLESAAAEASRQKTDIRKFRVTVEEEGSPETVWVILRDPKLPIEIYGGGGLAILIRKSDSKVLRSHFER